MNPVSRRELKTATWALAGVAALGVALGIENSLSTLGASSEASGRGAPVPFNPAMANSLVAKPLAPEATPPSSAPASVADAGAAKTDQAASDSTAEDETGPASDAAAPPTLYAPPEAGPAAPAGAPAADDNNLPPY